MRRRRALSIPIVAVGAALGDPGQRELWTRLASALGNPKKIDGRAVEQLERGTLEFFRKEEFVAARMLAPSLYAHIIRVADILKGEPPEPHKTRLLMSIGEALALRGWFHFDMGDSVSALKAWDLAEAAAKDAKDGPLLACIYAYMSYLAEAEGRFGDAVNLLVAAQTHTHSASSAATRSWLAAREAEVRALRAETSEVDRAVERAVSVYDYARPEFERSWTGFFTPSRLGSMVVTSYMRVDHRDLALQADAVIASLSPTEAKIKAVILADLTAAAITSADLGRAAVLGQDALHATLTHEATLGAARLRNVQTMIVPRRGHDHALDDLHDAIAAQL